jgi:hypothetical protein
MSTYSRSYPVSIDFIKNQHTSGYNPSYFQNLKIPMKSSSYIAPKVLHVSGAIGDRLQHQLKNPNKDIREAAVTELERRIIKMQGRCPSNIIDDLKIRDFQLDPSVMSQYLAGPGIYDHSFQDGVSCLIDAMISTNPDDPSSDIRLRKWITDIKRIGKPSAEGLAFKLQNGNYPLYVIKVASNPKYDTLAHEAVVGMGAINRIRDRIPNFVHTYAAFSCSPPILDTSGNVVSWCPKDTVSKNTSITYLVLENIDNATPLSSLASSLTNDEFLQIYLQLLNALNVAYKEFDYTHYDLHSDNVLIQTLPYTVSIPLYNPRGGLLYIKTTRLARIIDFGLSHIYLQGQHFGKFGYEYYNLDPESSFPMYDAYKILLSSYWNSLKNTSTGITDIVRKIYSFFNEGYSLEQRISYHNTNLNTDYFQPSTNLKSITFDFLILYILDNFVDLSSPESFIVKYQPTDAIATICHDKCVTWNTFIKSIFDKTRLPSTLTDYCHAITAIDKLSNPQYKQSLKLWLKQFDTQKTYFHEKHIFHQNINSYIKELNTVKLDTVNHPNFNTFLYSENIYKLIRIRSAFIDSTLWVTSVICAFNSHIIPPNVSHDITNILKLISAIRHRINSYRSIIEYNINYAFLYNIFFDDDITTCHNLLLS